MPPRQLSTEEQQALRDAYDHVNLTQKAGLTLVEIQRAIGIAYTVCVSDACMQEFAKEFESPQPGSAGQNLVHHDDADQHTEQLYTFNQCILGVVKCPAFGSLDEIFEWRKKFDTYDADHSGTIDAQELEEMVVEIVGDNGDVEQVMEDLGLPETEVPWMEYCKVMLRLNGMPSKDLFVSRPPEPEKLLALRQRDAQELLESGDDLLPSP